MKPFMILVLLLGTIFTSCEKDAAFEEAPQKGDVDVAPTFEDVEVPSTHIFHQVFKDLEVNLDAIKQSIVDYPDGSIEEVMIVEDDIVLSNDQITALSKRHDHSRQAAHTHYVKGINQINIYCSTNNWSLSTAVNRAINNYNAVNNLGINFVRVPYAYLAHIHVYLSTYAPPLGGLAGYPNPSLYDLNVGKTYPYRWARVGMLVPTLTLDEIEHVVTHEIGHCLGLRHTDWNTGLSCGTFAPETPPGWQIWGTPTNDASSIMNKCYPSTTSGEFTFFDAFALGLLF